MDLFLLALGIVLLYVGGEALVGGSVALARALGLTPLVIGLTVVAFGTSAPELAATLTAAFKGSPEIAFGNVVGSNIANLGLILGLTSVIYPLVTTARFLWREVPFMLGSSLLMFALLVDGEAGRIEGAVFLVLIVPYLAYLLRKGERPAVVAEFAGEYGDGERRPSVPWAVVRVAAGIALLVLGAQTLVEGAVGLARALGVSERVIGLTMVAFRTSLPELAAALVAAIKREADIILGNLIGSNIFNILVILGTTSLIHPIAVDPVAGRKDLAVMLGISFLTWPLLFSGLKMRRLEGAVLLAAYFAYLAWLAAGGGA